MSDRSAQERGRIGDALSASLPKSLVDYAEAHPAANQWMWTAGLLAVFIVVETFFERGGYLPSTSYAEPSLVLGVFTRIGPQLAGAALLAGAVLIAFGRLSSSWLVLQNGRQVRWFVVGIAATVSWPLATMGYNYYFDQAYVAERVLLVALVPLLYVRPVFIYPYLLVAYPMMWQIDIPSLSAGAALLHKTHLLRVLDLFAAALLVHAVTGRRSTRDFVFLICCLIGAIYWLPAWTKWQLDWLSYGHLYRMPLAAHAHGWLSALDPRTVVEFSQAIVQLTVPMQIFVLVAESACLVMLWRRGVTVLLLVTLSVFHVGVFILYGYLFWTWILLNLALASLLLGAQKTDGWQIYGGHRVVLGAALVLLGTYWASPSALGWYDTRLSYTYRYEVIGDSGERYTLPVRFFEPYGDVFTMSNFGYLTPTHKMLVFPYGTTRVRAIADALNDATTAAQIFALEETIGRARYLPDRSATFYEFIVRYLANYNAHNDRMYTLGALGAPPQFWSSTQDRAYTGQEPIREVVVFEVTTLFDETQLADIRKIKLAQLAVPSGADAR